MGVYVAELFNEQRHPLTHPKNYKQHLIDT
jgi:hypothetical protein